jgi:hypothetical protein
VSSPSKKRGTSWESAVVQYLQQAGWPHAERRVLHGALDRGDVLGLPGVVIECKSASRIQLSEWLKEAQAETANAGAEIGFVWAKRVGKSSPGSGFVIMDGETAMRLLKLAGW